MELYEPPLSWYNIVLQYFIVYSPHCCDSVELLPIQAELQRTSGDAAKEQRCIASKEQLGNQIEGTQSMSSLALDQLSVNSSVASRGDDTDAVLSTSTADQLATEMQRRQKSLGKLVQLYNTQKRKLEPSAELSRKVKSWPKSA